MAGFKNRPILGFFSFASALAVLVFFVQAHAAVPQIINYQGRLEDASGNLQGGSSGTNFDFKFSIWNVSSTGSGTRLWPTSAPASTTHKVTSGVFDARLGDAAQGFSALTLDFNTSTIYYLQIDVYSTSSADFETLSPRQAIVASGFAINADTVDGAHAGTSVNNVLQLDPSGGINLPNGSSTFAGAVALNSTLNVGGVTTLAGFTFTNATGTGNLQIATLLATGMSSLQGLTFTNATGTGNIQTATANITGQSALASVSSTNLTASGYLQTVALNASGQSNLAAVSSTNLTASGYLTILGNTNLATTTVSTTLTVTGNTSLQGTTFTNASGTNITVTGYGTFPTLNSTNATIANVSSTNFTASGFVQGSSLNISGQSTLASVSSTNLTASGFLQGATLNISGQSTLASVSSTNVTASGYGIIPTFSFTNASGTNITASGFLQGGSLTLNDESFTDLTGYGLANTAGVLSVNTSAVRDFDWIGSGTTLTASSSYNLVQVFGISSSTELRSPSGTIATLTFTNASGTNLTASGFIQGATLAVSGQSALASVSSTNLTASGFLQTVALNASGQSNLAAVSSTNLTASGYLTVLGNTNLATTTVSTTLTVLGNTSLQGTTFTNASGTNISVTGYGTFPTLNFTSAVGTNVSSTNVAVTGLTSCTEALETDSTGRIVCGTDATGGGSGGGIATSSLGNYAEGNIGFFLSSSTMSASSGLSFVSSTGKFSVTSVSSTNITASGFLQGAALDISGQSTLANVSSTNLTASGYLQGATLNISGTSTLATITGATTTLTGVLTANLAYLTSTSTAAGRTLTLTSDGATSTLTSQDIRLRVNVAASGTVATFYPRGEATRGLYVNGHMLIGQAGISVTAPLDAAVLFVEEKTSQADFLNGFSFEPTYDTNLVGLQRSGGTFRSTFADGFDPDAAGGAVTFNNVFSDIRGSVATAMSGKMLLLTAYNATIGSSIPAGSTAWDDVVGYNVTSPFQVTGVTPLRTYGIRVQDDGNGSSIQAAASFAGNVYLHTTSRLGFGRAATVSSTNSIRAKLSLRPILAMELGGTDIYEFAPSSFYPVTTVDLGSATSTWQTGYFGTSVVVSSTGATDKVVIATGTIAIATSSQFSATTTLTVCAKGNCTLPTTSTSTDTVAYFASTGGLTTDTSIVARGVITSGQADIGEFVHVVGPAENYEAGDLLSISTAEPGKFEISAAAYDEKLAGIVTETAGLVAGGGDDGRGSVIMALAGRLPIKVTGQNGPIAIGDYLAASDVTGHAMKAIEEGKVIAIAMESFSGTTSGDSGTILAFIAPQWYAGMGGSKIGSTLQGSGTVVQGGTSSVINNYNLDPSMAITFNDLTAKRLTIGSSDEPTGFTMFDTKTKEPYCVHVEDGVLKTIPGVCSTAISTDDAPPPPPPPPPPPVSTPTSTSTPPTSTSTAPADDPPPPEPPPPPSATSTPSEPPADLPLENASTTPTPTMPDTENASSTGGGGI